MYAFVERCPINYLFATCIHIFINQLFYRRNSDVVLFLRFFSSFTLLVVIMNRHFVIVEILFIGEIKETFYIPLKKIKRKIVAFCWHKKRFGWHNIARLLLYNCIILFKVCIAWLRTRWFVEVSEWHVWTLLIHDFAIIMDALSLSLSNHKQSNYLSLR